MSDNPRIEELRRRVLKDPASIAFAQLAEEHRRAGEYDAAVRVCHAGLVEHPAYVSARVTLGRSLVELGRFEEAETEFRLVLQAAPDNIIAVRELADIHQRARRVSHAREQQRVSEILHAPTSELSDLRSLSPDSELRAASPVDPVLAELETWLDVISERRLARHN